MFKLGYGFLWSMLFSGCLCQVHAESPFPVEIRDAPDTLIAVAVAQDSQDAAIFPLFTQAPPIMHLPLHIKFLHPV